MGVPRDIDARHYYRVAQHRMEEGQLLLRVLKRPVASIYLSGYAVECILKALLLENTAPRRRTSRIQGFRGHKGHDLAWLVEQLHREGVTAPEPIAKDLALVSSWSTDLRYNPGNGDPVMGARFVDATARIVQWAKGKV